MSKKLYAGNLNYSADSASLENLFPRHGDIMSVNVVADGMTSRARRFAFVGMESDSAAQAAVSGLNATEADGRQLRVDIAQERGWTPRPGGYSDRY